MKRLPILALLLTTLLGLSHAEVTRFPGGLSTDPWGGLFGELPIPMETSVHVENEDFNRYLADDWTIKSASYTLTDGLPTAALTAADGGVMLLSGINGIASIEQLQITTGNFTMESGKKFWFETNVKTDNISDATMVVGLSVLTHDIDDATQCIQFMMVPGSGSTNFVTSYTPSGTATEAVASAITSMVTDTYQKLGFYYDGASTIKYYADSAYLGIAAITTMPTDTLSISAALISSTTGQAGDKALYIDYIYVAKER